MAGRSKVMMRDPSGKGIVGYLFGDVFFNITGPHKPRINGYSGDQFGSEQELVSSYDQTGQGVDLFRVYEDDTRVKLRPNPPENKP